MYRVRVLQCAVAAAAGGIPELDGVVVARRGQHNRRVRHLRDPALAKASSSEKCVRGAQGEGEEEQNELRDGATDRSMETRVVRICACLCVGE